ncbi:MAG: hypothetical protein M0R77_03610 [Gammaproteobacteria bacterium]|nr:hypothetical protein [Gammaproteobacteria bacterium]
MNLLRILLLIAIGWLVYQVLVRPWLGSRRLRQRAPRQVQAVRCARCGIHLPAGDAVTRDGQAYCSQEHSRLGPD